MRWVTAFGLSGDAFTWWLSWKEGKQDVTRETFERAFIKKFIPDWWEMIEASKDEEEESHEYVFNETTKINEDSNLDSDTDCKSFQNFIVLTPTTPKPLTMMDNESGPGKEEVTVLRTVSVSQGLSDLNLHCAPKQFPQIQTTREKVKGLSIKRKRRKKQLVTSDTLPLPAPQDLRLPAKALLEPKPPDLETFGYVV